MLYITYYMQQTCGNLNTNTLVGEINYPIKLACILWHNNHSLHTYNRTP